MCGRKEAPTPTFTPVPETGNKCSLYTAGTEYGNTKPLRRPHFHIPRVCACCVFYRVTKSAGAHPKLKAQESLGENFRPVLTLTYRQKLLKADLIVIVAVELLDDVPNHVAGLGVADAFQELVEFVITDMIIFVQICADKGIKCQNKQLRLNTW